MNPKALLEKNVSTEDIQLLSSLVSKSEGDGVVVNVEEPLLLASAPTSSDEEKPMPKEDIKDVGPEADSFVVYYKSVATDGTASSRAFVFSLLPAVESSFSKSMAMPEVKPGIMKATAMDLKRFTLPGWAPVVQSLGIKQTVLQIVGIFVGNEEITEGGKATSINQFDIYNPAVALQANGYAQVFDRHVIQSAAPVTIEIISAKRQMDPSVKIAHKACIQNFRYFSAESDLVYYAFDAILLDYNLVRTSPVSEKVLMGSSSVGVEKRPSTLGAAPSPPPSSNSNTQQRSGQRGTGLGASSNTSAGFNAAVASVFDAILGTTPANAATPPPPTTTSELYKGSGDINELYESLVEAVEKARQGGSRNVVADVSDIPDGESYFYLSFVDRPGLPDDLFVSHDHTILPRINGQNRYVRAYRPSTSKGARREPVSEEVASILEKIRAFKYGATSGDAGALAGSGLGGDGDSPPNIRENYDSLVAAVKVARPFGRSLFNNADDIRDRGKFVDFSEYLPDVKNPYVQVFEHKRIGGKRLLVPVSRQVEFILRQLGIIRTRYVPVSEITAANPSSRVLTSTQYKALGEAEKMKFSYFPRENKYVEIYTVRRDAKLGRHISTRIDILIPLLVEHESFPVR